MKATALLLMLSGWLIAICALGMLRGAGQRYIFVLAGLAVEGLGVGLLAERYRAHQMPERKRR